MLVRGFFDCFGCGESFLLTYEEGSPQVCPLCNTGNIVKTKEEVLQDNAQEKACGNCGCGQHSHEKKEE